MILNTEFIFTSKDVDDIYKVIRKTDGGEVLYYEELETYILHNDPPKTNYGFINYHYYIEGYFKYPDPNMEDSKII